MRILAFLISFVSCQTLAESCGNYEYGSLSVNVIVVEKQIDGLPTAVTKNIWTTWKQHNKTGTWFNDKIMTGSIKKPLTEYFDIQTIDEISILNRLGSQGWIAFSHAASQRKYPSSVDEWYLKRCSK